MQDKRREAQANIAEVQKKIKVNNRLKITLHYNTLIKFFNITEEEKKRWKVFYIQDIHLELEKTHRGEDKYLVLVTQEHQVLKEINKSISQSIKNNNNINGSV